MSKGLGSLQLEILDTLATARTDAPFYLGDGRQPWYDGPGRPKPESWRWDLPGWVIHRGLLVRLPENIYDLRASLVYLANRHEKTYARHYVVSAYQTAFSRAVRTLIDRGALRTISVIPVVDWRAEDEPSLHKLSDGVYMLTWTQQRRFVTLP